MKKMCLILLAISFLGCSLAINEPEKPIKAQWENVTQDKLTARMPVYGGWLVRVTDFMLDRESKEVKDWHVEVVFVPDPKHEWMVMNDQK